MRLTNRGLCKLGVSVKCPQGGLEGEVTKQREEIPIEGERSKPFSASSGGDLIGSYDSATEMLEQVGEHRRMSREKGKYTYTYLWEEIRIEQVRQMANEEKK